ncbi:PepSY-associated TM helix domain-containing protein [Vibrio splendidus]|uniref:PepSY-associated TM helix domain-containing protein n=1 Tax=Vibrio splendidus TaxID=29497 RepID=UPI0006CA1D6A|nr:PepSY-associated TM helix domain-containing protein [Vibrio splendidus]KPL98975.1 peptidase [Vibrio splendidus]MDH5910658.1 PepSY-associated TM helix domain-containing protein [Vibrio splendidus]MDH5940718.1 PepSY-associated TM helix domain-containing protein [Vibrio splendidus]MDH5983516.1 PepSY-associated TM helix domain-containing protein [Vibrio splendidus]MDH5992743.1 PepSY-associated TM helix domain-containing protein [Vibrio splendidus]
MSLKSRAVQSWARRLHVYISMALLFVVLFFSVTGITLNRPELFESTQPNIQRSTLTLPTSLFSIQDGRLKADETAFETFLFEEANLSGVPSGLDIYAEIEGGELLIGEVSMDFKGPGYNASVFVDVASEMVEVETTNYGVIALLNDLHKGRNSGEVWKWFIDITALLMIFFVLTGVCLLLPKKKTLNTSIKWMVFGSAISLAIYFVAVP